MAKIKGYRVKHLEGRGRLSAPWVWEVVVVQESKGQ